MTDLERRIARYLVDELAGAPDGTTVTLDESLVEAGLLDSLSVMRLVGWLEDEIGVEVDADDVTPENFETLAGIVALVTSKGAR